MTQSVSADTESIVRAVERLDLNDEGADGLIGAVASLNLGKDDDHRDGRDATLQNTYTGAGHGRAHAGAAGAATSSPGATDAAASNLLRAATAAAGTGASDAIDADAGTCDADAFWFARAMEPDVDWSSSASLRAFVLKHDVWPCMGHPLREPMLEAIAALEGVNPDITFSDSAALVPTEGRRGRRRHRGDRHRRALVLGSGVRRGFLLRIRGLQLLLRGCQLRVRRSYVFLRLLAERRREDRSRRDIFSPRRRRVRDV